MGRLFHAFGYFSLLLLLGLPENVFAADPTAARLELAVVGNGEKGSGLIFQFELECRPNGKRLISWLASGNEGEIYEWGSEVTPNENNTLHVAARIRAALVNKKAVGWLAEQSSSLESEDRLPPSLFAYLSATKGNQRSVYHFETSWVSLMRFFSTLDESTDTDLRLVRESIKEIPKSHQLNDLNQWCELRPEQLGNLRILDGKVQFRLNSDGSRK